MGPSVVSVLAWAGAILGQATADATMDEEENDRDVFINRLKADGMPRKQIRTMINERARRKGWRPLESDQAISQADRRYKARTGTGSQSHK
jgi:hypothetical protein